MKKEGPPTEFKPVAVIVQAQTKQKLQFLNEEVDEISHLLKQSGYEVKVITTPSVAKLKKVFTNEKYRDRIAIFHYAGHAQNANVVLKGEKPAYFDGLAGFLEQQKAMRMIFLNGCSSDGYENYIGSNAKNIFFLFSNCDIADFQAKEFAVRFYRFLATGADCGRAFREARASFALGDQSPRRLDSKKLKLFPIGAAKKLWAFPIRLLRRWGLGMDLMKKRADKRFEVVSRGIGETSHHARWPWKKCGNESFSLAKGYLTVWENISRTVQKGGIPVFSRLFVLLICLLLGVFGFSSLEMTYGVANGNSPAFQASFGYATDFEKELEKLNSSANRFELIDLIDPYDLEVCVIDNDRKGVVPRPFLFGVELRNGQIQFRIFDGEGKEVMTKSEEAIDDLSKLDEFREKLALLNFVEKDKDKLELKSQIIKIGAKILEYPIHSDLFGLRKAKVSQGKWIESIRLILLLVILYVMNGYIFRESWWKNKILTAFFGIIFLAIMVTLTWYHFYSAPSELRTENNLPNAWNLKLYLVNGKLHTSPAGELAGVWEMQRCGALFEEFQRSERFRWEQVDLFNRPYQWYFGYSIVTFLIIAPLLLFTIVYGAIRSYLVVQFNYKTLRGAMEAESIDKVREVSSITQVAFGDFLVKYSVLLSLVCIGLHYEIAVGFRTLANAAQIITIGAFLLLCVGLIIVAVTIYNGWRAYTSIFAERPELRGLLSDQQPSQVLSIPIVSILLIAIISTAGVAARYFLSGVFG